MAISCFSGSSSSWERFVIGVVRQPAAAANTNSQKAALIDRVLCLCVMTSRP